jgi:hypothetical protein
MDKGAMEMKQQDSILHWRSEYAFLHCLGQQDWQLAYQLLLGTSISQKTLILGVEKILESATLEEIPDPLCEAIASGLSDEDVKKHVLQFASGHYMAKLWSLFFRNALPTNIYKLVKHMTSRQSLKYLVGSGSPLENDLCVLAADLARTLWADFTSQFAATPVEHPVLKVMRGQSIDEFPDLHSLWHRTCAVVRVGTLNVIDENWPIVHALTQSANDTFSFLLSLALKLYPDQVRTRDARGRLPLHYIVAHYPHAHICERCSNEGCSDDCPATDILQLFPDGAKSSDVDGKLPLALALESYESVSEYAPYQFGNVIVQNEKKVCWFSHADAFESMMSMHPLFKDAGIIEERIIDPLIQAAPTALKTRDVKTGFYPFQTAAAHGAPVNVIYKMLRQRPDVLKNMEMSDSEQLRQENTMLRKRVKEQEAAMLKLQRQLKALQGGSE